MVGITSTILIKVEILKIKSPKVLGKLLTITGMTQKVIPCFTKVQKTAVLTVVCIVLTLMVKTRKSYL